jgi:soluble lytic murein transglycosylase-like protein
MARVLPIRRAVPGRGNSTALGEVHPKPLTLRHFAVAVAFVAVIRAVPAQADIYAWRDEHGRLVVSEHPAPAGISVRTFAVRGNEAFRTTRADGPRSTLESRLHATVADHAARHAINPDLVRAVIRAESGWNPRAVSPKGAMGLMQLMPATAAEYGVADPFDPAENIRAGVAYLRWLLDRFDGKTELALAAYNAGPGAVEKYGRTIPPYRETRSYVRRIVSVTELHVGPRRSIYKIVELIDGREVPRYSDRKPEGTYELVTRR